MEIGGTVLRKPLDIGLSALFEGPGESIGASLIHHAGTFCEITVMPVGTYRAKSTQGRNRSID